MEKEEIQNEENRNILCDNCKTDRIREYVKYYLNNQNKTCSYEDIQKIIKIFETCKNGIPKFASYEDDNGNVSYGFYIVYAPFDVCGADFLK